MPVTGPKILRLLYLHKIEFHRSCAAEDRNQHPHLPLFGTHFFHCSVEILEGPTDTPDRSTHPEVHLVPGSELPLAQLPLHPPPFSPAPLPPTPRPPHEPPCPRH